MTNSVWKPTVFKVLCSRFPTISTNIYVIGFVEGGERYLSCRNQEYTIGKGNVILFNPGDSHACVQTDDGTLDYRGFNITKEVMLDLAEEVTGERELPGFLQNKKEDAYTSSFSSSASFNLMAPSMTPSTMGRYFSGQSCNLWLVRWRCSLSSRSSSGLK